MKPTDSEITRLLFDWSQGEEGALEKLMPLVVDELRRMARRHFEGESLGHTLQPTALVNEVYMRLAGNHKVRWESRAQFFGFAARLMRRILVDHARRRRAEKRSPGSIRVSLEGLAVAVAPDTDVIALDDALRQLAELDPRQSRIIELRFFAGLTQEETAEVLGISTRTVKREWQTAKRWLYRQLAQV